MSLPNKTINEESLMHIQGGLNIGTAVFGLVTGFVMGGPVGLGVAASALVGAEGVNKLVDMYHE